jgi:hypothetical protein
MAKEDAGEKREEDNHETTRGRDIEVEVKMRNMII